MTQDEMTALERGAERIAGMNLAAPTLDGISTVTQANEQAPARRTPVKGVCVKCGKHHSRHIRVDEFAYCNQDRQSHFTLERETVKPAEAAPGAITREQAIRLTGLIQVRESRRSQWEAAVDHATACEGVYQAALAELDDFIASITAK